MNQEDIDSILNLDFESPPEVTQRILAAIDRSQDPHLQIDILRRAIYKLAVKLQQMGQALKVLQDAERDRLTQTSVLRTVKDEFSRREINWMKWAVRGVLGLAGTAALGLISWVLKLAWQGLTK